MSPRLPVNDVLNGVRTNRILFSHAVAGSSLSMSGADFPYLFLIEDGLRAINASAVLAMLPENSVEDAGGVEQVFTASDDLKVFQSIVVFNSVDVINHHAIGNGTDKKLINKAVNFKSLYSWSSRTQGDDVVPVFVYTALDDLPSAADNSAKVGDLIAFPLGEVRPRFVFHNGTLQ